jgi:hypothetical protein
MSRLRPTAVTVLAILNIVIGSLYLLVYSCCCAGLLLIGVFLDRAAAQDEPTRLFKDFVDALTAEAPSALIWLFGMLGIEIILAVGLLVGGIGLLRLQPWARLLCIMVAIAFLLAQVAWLIYEFTILQTALESARQQVARMGAPPDNPLPQDVSRLVIEVVEALYQVILLVFLLQPRIARAFKPEPALPDNRDQWHDTSADQDG